MAEGSSDQKQLPHGEPILGAGDANSGGGNASGNPDGDTGEAAPGALKGDVKKDRERLFPEAKGKLEEEGPDLMGNPREPAPQGL